MNTRFFTPHAVVLLLAAFLALSGCSTKKQPLVEQSYNDPYSFEAYLENREKQAARLSMTQEERFAYDNRTASLAHMRHEGVPLSNLHLIEQAKTVIGTPYVPGGTSPDGFDCSGFVQWAYRNVGVRLPRTAREQSVMGHAIKSESMKAGDIVAFNHPQRGYHTGIYLGDGKFIHSPGRGKSVTIAPLSDPYFRSTFIGARRVRASESDTEAVKRLMAMDEHVRRDVPSVTNRRTATRKQVTERATTRKKEPTAPSRQERKKNTPVAVASRTRPAATPPAEKQQKTQTSSQKTQDTKTPDKKAPEKKNAEKKSAAPVKEAPKETRTKDAPKDSKQDSRQSVKTTPAPQKEKRSEKKSAPAPKTQEKKIPEKKEPQRSKPQEKQSVQPARKATAAATTQEKAKPAATRPAQSVKAQEKAKTQEKPKPAPQKQAPPKTAPPKAEKPQKQAAPAPKQTQQTQQKQQPAKTQEKPKPAAQKQTPAKNGTSQKTR